MSDRWAVARLDDIDALPGPGTLRWRPVRAHFEIRAFGTNAYTAERAGDDVVEQHTEEDDAGGHQELYFVARGRARFALGGESFEARIEMRSGDPRAAIEALRRAIDAEPGRAQQARDDEALAPLRGEPGFGELTGG